MVHRDNDKAALYDLLQLRGYTPLYRGRYDEPLVEIATEWWGSKTGLVRVRGWDWRHQHTPWRLKEVWYDWQTAWVYAARVDGLLCFSWLLHWTRYRVGYGYRWFQFQVVRYLAEHGEAYTPDGCCVSWRDIGRRRQ